ncbi:MAG: SCO family protein [Chloroflexi bacterium]|nr:SCO family protein [Chloroflexota bacterium]
MRRYLFWLLLGTVSGLLITSAVILLNRPYTPRGSLIDPPVPAEPFTLTDGRGETFNLSEQRGSLVVIFFGFTACPDVCPASLSDMKRVHDRLAKEPGMVERVKFVFITVDPDRDTPEKTGKYVSAFSPDFIGLSGSEEELEPVWKSFGVYRELHKDSPDDTVYTVDHSAWMYLIDQDGNLRLTYTFGTPVDHLLSDIRYLLKQG